MNNQLKIVEVYKARGELEAQVIKGLLESHDIPCLFQSNTASSVHAFAIDGLGEVRVMVPEDMADKARELIKAD